RYLLNGEQCRRQRAGLAKLVEASGNGPLVIVAEDIDKLLKAIRSADIDTIQPKCCGDALEKGGILRNVFFDGFLNVLIDPVALIGKGVPGKEGCKRRPVIRRKRLGIRQRLRHERVSRRRHRLIPASASTKRYTRQTTFVYRYFFHRALLAVFAISARLSGES